MIERQIELVEPKVTEECELRFEEVEFTEVPEASVAAHMPMQED